MRKTLSVVLVLALLLSATSVFAAGFSDVASSAYYYNAVNNLADKNIIGGFPDGTFKPNNTVTRAQLAVMLVNANGIDPASKTSNFSDVPKSHWAYGFVSAAADAGYLAGYPDGSFRPVNGVSYNEALTMIVASMGYKAADLTGSYPSNFTNKAKEIGLLKTCNKTGSSSATRADIACFINDSFSAIKPGQASETPTTHQATAGESRAVDKAKSYLNVMAFSHDGLEEQLKFEGFTDSEAKYGADNCGADWSAQALKKAKSYLSTMAFSYEGLIDQLEFEKFTSAQAKYGVDNCGADWNEQALKKAKSYLNTTAFSYKGLIDQLEFEKFTSAQAKYGVDNCGADWKEQAVKKAKSYLSIMSMSKSELISQLEFEGFTHEQAVYGADQAY